MVFQVTQQEILIENLPVKNVLSQYHEEVTLNNYAKLFQLIEACYF